MLLALGVFAGVNAARAGRHGQDAKAALLRAEGHLSSRNLDLARQELTSARAALDLMESELDGLGPLVPVARLVPGVRSQVIAVETIQEAGVILTEAGLRLADAAQQTLESTQGGTPVARALESMRAINGFLSGGAADVERARAMVDDLEGRWLVGPIADARDDLLERLPRYSRQVTSTAEGLDALIRFAGGEGPRRYLFLSQNPDEIRPTGGFMGTYGLMSASTDSLSLEQFAGIGVFRQRHPQAVVPGGEARSPFRFSTPPLSQTLANVNSRPDFVEAAEMAVRLWNGVGEPPIDGVVSFTPGFLARIVAVLGPVQVEEYGETITGDNLIERFTFYTVRLESEPGFDTTRKAFLGSLAEVVLRRLLEAPSDQWLALAGAVGDGFAAREGMAWTTDERVADVLADRRWDGTMPETPGDFFYNAEWSYFSKAGRNLQRTFDHHVELRENGSARITTVMRVTNTKQEGNIAGAQVSYITVYGPRGAVLDRASDPPHSPEPELAGHPAAGWFLAVEALGSSELEVVWEVPELARRGPDGTRVYDLWWLGVPDHTGDVLNLRVDLPSGWSWSGEAPPGQVSLDEDVRGSWSYGRG